MCRILALYLGDEILAGKSLFAFVPPPNPPHSGNIPSSFNLISADKPTEQKSPQVLSLTHHSLGLSGTFTALRAPPRTAGTTNQLTSPPGVCFPLDLPSLSFGLWLLCSPLPITPLSLDCRHRVTRPSKPLCFLLAFLPLSVQ